MNRETELKAVGGWPWREGNHPVIALFTAVDVCVQYMLAHHSWELTNHRHEAPPTGTGPGLGVSG